MSQKQAGQGWNALWMETEGDLIEIYTVERAADVMGYNTKYIGQLCADLKLIATKISGRWFPHRNACENYGKEFYEDAIYEYYNHRNSSNVHNCAQNA